MKKRESYLGLEINRSQSCLVISVDKLFEGRKKRKGLLNPDAVGEGESRPSGGIGIGEYDGDELRGEGVEMVGGLGSEEREKLIECGTLGASSDDAENNVQRQRRIHEVLVPSFLRQQQLCHAEGNIGLVADRFTQVHCYFGSGNK